MMFQGGPAIHAETRKTLINQGFQGKKEIVPFLLKKEYDYGPSDRIRTCGLVVPNHARYQLRNTRSFQSLYNIPFPNAAVKIKCYDGTLQSLEDHSHRPHSHPRQHQPAEIKLIDDMRRRNPNAGPVVFWVKLRQHGYSRSISGLYRFLRKRGQMAVKLPNPKYVPQKNKAADYPGQKVQIDVKYVPASCLVGTAVEDAKENGGYYYQYAFTDEYSPDFVIHH